LTSNALGVSLGVSFGKTLSLSGTVLPSTFTSSSLTSLGTLTGLNVGTTATINGTLIVPNNKTVYTTTGRPVVYLGSTISQYYGNKFIFQDAFETTDIACLSVSGLRIGDSTIASYSLDTLGSCNILGQYKIAGTNVITGSGLGSGIVNASLNSVVPIGGSLLVSGHTNISPGSEYKINSVSVLSNTTLEVQW